MDELNVSIVFYGKPNGKWLEWYEDAKKVFDIVGHEYNYVGTTLMDQMRTVKRTEKRVYRELENNQVSDITMQALPKDFDQAYFDYEITISRFEDRLQFIFNASDYEKIEVESLISTFKKYVSQPQIEIFEMKRSECPSLYASKINKEESYPELYPSLKILRKID